MTLTMWDMLQDVQQACARISSCNPQTSLLHGAAHWAWHCSEVGIESLGYRHRSIQFGMPGRG